MPKKERIDAAKKARIDAAFASLRQDLSQVVNHRAQPINPKLKDHSRTCIHCQTEHPDVDQSLKIYTCPTCTKYLPSVLKRGQQ